jgi:hypothetical protein
MSRLDFPFPQIATGDLDIPVFGQLLPTNLPLRDEFEPSPVKVIAFKAAFRRGGLWKQDLEDAPGNTHHAVIFTDADAELDDRALRIPPGVWRKAEKHASLDVFCECSQEHATDGPRRRAPIFFPAAQPSNPE